MNDTLRKKIFDYIDGRMSISEIAQFEEQMARDANLRFTVDEALTNGLERPQKTVVREQKGKHTPTPSTKPKSTARPFYTQTWFIFLLGFLIYKFAWGFFQKNNPFDRNNASNEVLEQEMEDGLIADHAKRPDFVLPSEGELDGDTIGMSENELRNQDSYPIKSDASGCSSKLAEADALYKKGKYSKAQVILFELAEGENTACQADGWYYLGLIEVQTGNPENALQFFAKVDNLNKYGDDIQWYIAICMYDIAQYNPEAQKQAKRALSRILESNHSAARKQKAEEMLSKMSNQEM